MAACCSWRELLERGVRADRSAVSMWPRAVDSMGVLREERFGPTLPRAQEGGGGQPGRGTGQNRAQNSQLAGTYSRIHGPDWPRGGQSHGQDLSFGWRGCSCRGGEQKGTPHVHGTTPRTMDTPCPFVARATRQSRTEHTAAQTADTSSAQAADKQSAGCTQTERRHASNGRRMHQDSHKQSSQSTGRRQAEQQARCHSRIPTAHKQCAAGSGRTGWQRPRRPGRSPRTGRAAGCGGSAGTAAPPPTCSLKGNGHQTAGGCQGAG